jgi:hypothetical protein
MVARTRVAGVAVSLLVLLAGCGDDASGGDAGADAGGELADAGPDAGPREPDICDELELSRVPFRASGGGTRFGEVAGDFTVQTLGAPFHLAERWSGCESYVFFAYFPDRQSDALFGSAPDTLVLESPRNVRYFFLTDEPDVGARRARMEALSARFEEGLALWVEDPALRDSWRERFHFVTDRATEVEGSVGAHLRDYMAYRATPESIVDLGERGRAPAPLPNVFGIDRAQTWDPGGSLSPSVGAAPAFRMGAYLAPFFDYRAALDARLDAEPATVVTLLDERTTGRIFRPEVTLPDAAAMATHDHLEVDVEITCDERNPFACSEWDRIAWVFLCTGTSADPAERCAERLEIARWITPYWRRGRQRWTIDATPFLGLMRAGGARTFFVELGPEWERATEWVAQVSLRFSTRGGAPRATGAVRAFTGGAFDASYNEREPFRFTPPAEATRVELVTILSGHGQTSGDNCAEWCDHRHQMTVNGSTLPLIRHEGERIGSDRGCATRASEGVVPGQWGNWAQARAYWCPGLPVEARRDDITARVTRGSENELTYQAFFRDGAPRGGDVALSAYVVWYVD